VTTGWSLFICRSRFGRGAVKASFARQVRGTWKLCATTAKVATRVSRTSPTKWW
jgi:hypothetical protein